MLNRLILTALLTVAGAGTAAACTCPKEALIKEYGTVSMLGHAQVQPGPVRPVAVQAAPVKSPTPQALPLLVPIQAPAGTGPTSPEWLLFEP